MPVVLASARPGNAARLAFRLVVTAAVVPSFWPPGLLGGAGPGLHGSIGHRFPVRNGGVVAMAAAALLGGRRCRRSMRGRTNGRRWWFALTRGVVGFRSGRDPARR